MLATWGSHDYNIYKNFLKLATFNISEVAKMAKINADEYFLCTGYLQVIFARAMFSIISPQF